MYSQATAPAPAAALWNGRQVSYSAAPRTGNDERDTAQTIAWMSLFAFEDARHPDIRSLAAQITAGANTETEKAARIWQWVRANIRFREDDELNLPFTGPLEVLIRPRDLLAMDEPAGDCDDFSQLVAALCIASGIEPRFWTVAAGPDSNYSHVYGAAQADRRRVALDASHGPFAGWEVPMHPGKKKREWKLSAMMRTFSKRSALSGRLGRLGLAWDESGDGGGGGIDWQSVIDRGISIGERYLPPPPQDPYGPYGPYGPTYPQQQPYPSQRTTGLTTQGNNLLLYGGLLFAGLFALSILKKK